MGVVGWTVEKPLGAVLGLPNSLQMCKTAFNFECKIFIVAFSQNSEECFTTPWKYRENPHSLGYLASTQALHVLPLSRQVGITILSYPS